MSVLTTARIVLPETSTAAGSGGCGGVVPPETSRARRAEESEALRIFLRLIRPRPLADPYPLYARLRDLAPLLPVRFPGVPAGYLVSTYAGCSRLLRNPGFGPPTHDQLDLLKPGWRDNSFTRYMYRSMVFLAGPAHRERRQAASRHFAPAQIARYRDELDQLAELLVERLARHGRHGAGPVDLMEHLALPFAALSLGRLLAIDDDEAIRLGRLARQVGTAFEQFASAQQHATVTRAGEELVRRLAVIVADRRGAQAGNESGNESGNEQSLLAQLAATDAGADETERLGAAVLLFGAGFDSPASMVGLGTRLLLEHPRQARLVADQPGLAPRAVAEILRYEPPVQLVARTALQPAELEGEQIPAGSMVFGLIGAANRDPAQVKEPEVFDVTREKVASLSFGAGPHYCLGAYLAGMQGEVLFPRLLRRFPGLRLAGPQKPPVYRAPGSTLRGLESLPLYLES
jgi:cytochrome P450